MAAPRAVVAALLLALPGLGVGFGVGVAAAVPPPPARGASVLLEPGSGRLRVLPGRHPNAIAWAALTDHSRAVGWGWGGGGLGGSRRTGGGALGGSGGWGGNGRELGGSWGGIGGSKGVLE